MPYRERVLAAVVLSFWGVYAAGRLLLFANLFRPWVVVPLAAIAAYLVWRRRPLRIRIPPLTRAFALALAAVGALLLVRLLKGLASPPLGWDSLTYHLFKAGRFAAGGRSIVETAPDAWGYYEFFPAAGSVIHGTTMLVARDGALVPVVGAFFGLFAALAVYVLARRLGSDRAPAGLAGLVMGATPAMASILTTGYADALVAGGLVSALALAPVPGDRRRWVRAALAGAACGLAAAAKTSAVPAAAALAAAIGVTTFAPALLFAGVAAFTALPEYLGPWLRTGNPLYPFGVTLGGRTLLEGNPQLTTLVAARSTMHDVGGYPGWEIFAWLGGTWRWPHTDFAGLGLGAAPVVLLAVAGLAVALRAPLSWRRLVGPGLVATALVLAAWSPDSLALRTLWASVFGRHVLPVWGVLLALAACAPWRWSRFVWPPVLVAGLAMSIPLGWGSADLRGTWILAVACAAGGALLLVPWRGRLLLALLPLAVAVVLVRQAFRWEVWSEAADTRRGPYDFHPLDPDAIGAWPMWERLDGVAPSRIAAACGWNGVSHSAYLYPLLGTRLQHQVVYVPPTIDGSVIDYEQAEALNRKAQLRAYLRALLDRGIDRIAVLHPAPPEHGAWMTRLPEIFVREWSDPERDNHLYRFERDRARAMLEPR